MLFSEQGSQCSTATRRRSILGCVHAAWTRAMAACDIRRVGRTGSGRSSCTSPYPQVAEEYPADQAGFIISGSPTRGRFFRLVLGGRRLIGVHHLVCSKHAEHVRRSISAQPAIAQLGF